MTGELENDRSRRSVLYSTEHSFVNSTTAMFCVHTPLVPFHSPLPLHLPLPLHSPRSFSSVPQSNCSKWPAGMSLKLISGFSSSPTSKLSLRFQNDLHCSIKVRAILPRRTTFYRCAVGRGRESSGARPLCATETSSVGEGEGTRFHPPHDKMPPDAFELDSVSAFDGIADKNGRVSICGFGSLLSEKSARSTFPNLLNFRVAVLPGFRRVFGHVAPIFLERGIANFETKEMSSLSVEPSVGEYAVVTTFDIPLSEVPLFIEREHEFRYLAVNLLSLQAESSSQKAGQVVCSRYSNEEYFHQRCQDPEEYNRRWGHYNLGPMWRDDILPCRVYLRHCVLAAKNLSQDAYDNFVDHTYLADRVTTIRQHLAADEQIMKELPPPSLRERYGG